MSQEKPNGTTQAQNSVASSAWLGRVLVYADGRRSRIVNVGCKINGRPGIVLEPIGEKVVTSQDTLATIEDVEKWVNLEIWRIEDERPNSSIGTNSVCPK